MRYKLQKVPLTDELDVVDRISAKDGMFTQGMEEHYRMVGRSALEAIRMAMLAAGRSDFQNILDLPCGHGRVMRALRAAFPLAQLTACDLDRVGVDFCTEHFDARPNYSHPSPDQIVLEGGYDLIWSGSLLTHLNSETGRRFLQLFQKLLAPGGIMVLTTHGRHVIRRLRVGTHTYGLEEKDIPALIESYALTGFGYADYSSQTGYGISICSPEWVLVEVAKLRDLSVVLFSECLWAQHQDVTACIRR